MKIASAALSVLLLSEAAAFTVRNSAATSRSTTRLQQSSFSYGAGDAMPGPPPPSGFTPSTPPQQGTSGALTNPAQPYIPGPGAFKDEIPAQITDTHEVKNLWDTLTPVIVQGGSLRTWSFNNQNVKRVQVLMKTGGRPLNANVDLWQGPDNTPQKMGVYIEDGNIRPFCAVLETPRGQNAIAIRNTGQMEFPLSACVEADVVDNDGNSSAGLLDVIQNAKKTETIQGGALKTYTFAPAVESIQVLLKTDGRPLNARIELLQGPNNNKQVIELYCEDGMERPFFTVIECPGVGNVVRVLNTAPMEFPMTASVQPYMVDPDYDTYDIYNEDTARGGDDRTILDRF